MQTKLAMAVLLGFVLVAAAACSGGGSLDQAEEDALQVERDAAVEAAEKAAEAAEAAQKAAEEAERLRQAEQEAREEAEEEAAEADRQRQAEQEAREEAEEARQAAEEARRQAEQERQAAEAARQEAEQGELNARAETYLAATNAGSAARSGVTVTHERGSTRKINPGGNFQAGSGAPGIPGFTAHTYTRRVSASEQTVYLYTNIQPPSTRPFWQLHGVNTISAAQDDAFDPTPTTSARVVTVVGQDRDYTDADTYDIAVTGTYDGVSGTYTCIACEIVDGDDDGTDVTAADFDADDWVTLVDGERSFVTGTWSFKPGSINSGVRQVRDNEHLYFGIWVREPNVASQAHSYEYIVGGMSSTLTAGVPAAGTLANFEELTGTAEFRGGAIGKYVTRDQVGDNARIGTFSATATLTADFGAANAAGTLEGRITNFRSPRQTLDGEWFLFLGDVERDANDVVTSEGPTAFSATGTITGQEVSGEIGGVPVSGTWNATLHGSDNVIIADADRDDYPVTSHPVANPAGIVGNFHATSTNAALAGAFGATPQ